MNTSILFRAFQILTLAAIGTWANASENSTCFGSLSTVDTGTCLQAEYKAVDGFLKKSVAQLIAIVNKSSRSWSIKEDINKQIKDDVIAAIKLADKQWRAMTKVECNVLAKTQYWGGSGDENLALDCLITRTSERLKFIHENEAYSDYWKP